MRKRGPKSKERVVTPPAKTIPKAPKHLDAASKKHWNRLAGQVNGMGVGSALDEDAMILYCDLWSRYRKAAEELAKPPAEKPGGEGGGLVITTVNYYRQVNPWYTIQTQCLKDIKALLGEFGLSPKARAKLVIPEAEEVDSKWEDFENEPDDDPEDEG